MKFLAALGILSVLGSCLWTTAQIPQTSTPHDYVLIIEDMPQMTEKTHLHIQTENGIRNLEMDEYLTCVVLSEMPCSFHLEALKAQAVAARTYAARALMHGKHTQADLCSDPGCCQAYHSKEELQDKLGDAFNQAWGAASEAVTQTEDQILCYGDEPIEALYSSCSGGRSEAAVAVWGSDVPYLRSVDSPGEEIAPRFESVTDVLLSDFCKALKGTGKEPQFSVIPQDWFGAVSYTEGGAVDTVEIGGAVFRGTELRSLFGLNSAKFTMSIHGGAVRFTCRGYGHGVGMSQYGAEAMAKAGKDWHEIVDHYYTGVTIKKLSRTNSGQWCAVCVTECSEQVSAE